MLVVPMSHDFTTPTELLNLKFLRSYEATSLTPTSATCPFFSGIQSIMHVCTLTFLSIMMRFFYQALQSSPFQP